MRKGDKTRMWIGACVVMVLIVTSCVPASAVPTPTAAPAEGKGTTEMVEGWRGGYDIVQPELCPPVMDDKTIEEHLQQPFFQQVIGQQQLGDKTVRAQQGLYANEQDEIFTIKVVGNNSQAGEDAILAYSGAVRVCLDLILDDGISDKIVADTEIVPAEGEEIVIGFEELPDPEQVTAESLIIEIESWGSITGGDLSYDELGTILKDTVLEDAARWKLILNNRVSEDYQLQYVPTDEAAKSNPDAVLDFIIDPSINNGVRHQYREYRQKSVLTTVSVAGNSGAGKVRAGLCKNSSSTPFMTRTVNRNGTKKATLSNSSSTSSTSYDLGVVGKQKASRYRMSGRWYRNYRDSPPGGSHTNCNP